MQPRNGPPEAVRTSESHRSRVAPLEALERGGVLAVDREEQAAAPLVRREREVAGRDEALLVGERERDAALERPERRAEAGEADDRVEDDVRLGALEQLGQVAADLRVSGASPSIGCEPDDAATSSSSGCAAMISSACRPIEPVAPSSATRFIASRASVARDRSTA